MNLVARERCPVCGGAPAEIGTVPTLNSQSPVRVRLLACADCGHWWHTPVPAQDELIDLYRASSPFVVTANAAEQYQQRVHDDAFLPYIERFLSNGAGARVLEIGAGGGQLVRELRRRGYTAYGVEPARWNPDEGLVDSLADLPEGLRFDVIILQDVLEHLFDPGTILSELRAHAAGGARLFCSVPCSDSRPARRYGVRWSMVLPFGHLHYYSFASARELLRRSGWETLDARLVRSASLWRLAAHFRVRTLAYEIVKGGRDQLYIGAGLAESAAS